MTSRTCTEDSVEERFYRYTDIPAASHHDPSVCWTWIGATRDDRYGQLGTSRGTESAHRISWRLHHDLNEQDLRGVRFGHTCGNRLCVRPDHLFVHPPGRRRSPKSGPLRGERNSNATFTDAQVREIKTAMVAGATLRSLALQYNTHLSTLSQIRLGNTWAHVGYDPPQQPPSFE